MNYKLKKSNYKFDFMIYATELNENEVFRILNVKADKFLESRPVFSPNGKNQYYEALYQISSKEYNSYLLGNKLNKFLMMFYSKIEQLIELKKRNKCSFKLFIPLYIIDNETLGIRFNNKVIDFCNKTNTEIEFYLYSYNEDEII
jgi:hypothetical protein